MTTSLTYLAVDDESLQDAVRHLPLLRLKLKHLTSDALREAATVDIVELHRPDGKIVLKNAFNESEVNTVTHFQ